MLRKALVAIVAGSGLLLSAPAESQRPEGGIWAKGAKSKKRKPKVQQETPASPENADLAAVERANDNSALAEGAVSSDSLPGLATGLGVKTSSGATLGQVSEVVTGTDGSIRLVIVTAPGGQTYRLAPGKLSISGGVVTTSETSFGG